MCSVSFSDLEPGAATVPSGSSSSSSLSSRSNESNTVPAEPQGFYYYNYFLLYNDKTLQYLKQRTYTKVNISLEEISSKFQPTLTGVKKIWSLIKFLYYK